MEFADSLDIIINETLPALQKVNKKTFTDIRWCGLLSVVLGYR